MWIRFIIDQSNIASGFLQGTVATFIKGCRFSTTGKTIYGIYLQISTANKQPALCKLASSRIMSTYKYYFSLTSASNVIAQTIGKIPQNFFPR